MREALAATAATIPRSVAAQARLRRESWAEPVGDERDTAHHLKLRARSPWTKTVSLRSGSAIASLALQIVASNPITYLVTDAASTVIEESGQFG